MMPAISLTPLPPLPPFQFMPEPDLNFGAVLEAVATPVPQPPATPEFSEPSETLLNFLGINPVKDRVPSSDSPPVKEEMPDTAKDESSVPLLVAQPLLILSPLSPQINVATQIPPPTGAPLLKLAIAETQSKPSPTTSAGDEANASTATRPDPVRTDFGFSVSPQLTEDATKTPLAPILNPFGLAPGGSLSKPSLSLDTEEKGSTSTATHREPVRTEFGGTPLSVTQFGLSEVSERPPSQLTTTTPPSDPLRFVVDRQLDLARDSRWLDALARDIVAVAEASDRLSFRLSPPQLGRLDIDLSASENGLSVRMNASTEAATQIIAAAQPRLIDELKSQGVRVAEAQVSTSSGGQSQGQGQQHQRDADQMIEFVRQRIERKNETNLTRSNGRFA